MRTVAFWSVMSCVLVLSACSNSGRDADVERRVTVKVTPAARRSIASYAHVSGTIQALQQAKVGSKVEGVIQEILVDEGDAVKKDQVLLRLEPADFTLGVDQARAALEQAEHDLAQQSQDWKRIANLYERRVVPKHRYDAMQAAHGIARARAAGARAALSLAQRRYEDAVVRSPFDGVITAKLMHAGEVSSLWAYKWEALEVMDISAVKIECNVSEKLKSRLQPGMQADVAVDALPAEHFAGTIAVVNPLVDAERRTFRIKIVIPNPEHRLTAGMFARVRITLRRKDGVLAIPVGDLLERLDGFFIFVVKDGVAEQRKITVGEREDDMIEVADGLQEGELVVTEGSHRLQSGRRVDLQP